MFYSIAANKISLVVSLCFSFFIFTYAFLLIRKHSQVKLLGYAFIIPLSLNIASFFTANAGNAYPFAAMSDLCLMAALLLIIWIKPGISQKKTFQILLTAFTFSLIWAIETYSVLPQYIKAFHIRSIIIMVLFLLYIIKLRNEKDGKVVLSWAGACITASSLVPLSHPVYLTAYISPGLRLAAYCLFCFYFNKKIGLKLINMLEEAEKKVAAVDKNLNLEVRKRVLEIERSNEKLSNIARTDALTKAYNKAAIMETINKLIESKETREFSIIMFDIDNFKTINDTLGHIEGDKCIKKLALIALRSIREIDSLGRYGGDEFIIVLPETSVPQARLIAERFRKKVAETESPHFTVSIGLAHYPTDALDAKGLIASADDGLYQSKHKGRNAVSYKNIF
ncbi:MAG: GGDEF domain-containing protein [Clostridia bacterium]|nr:GGDEF domain-containing protein [Clostridia bacterium]